MSVKRKLVLVASALLASLSYALPVGAQTANQVYTGDVAKIYPLADGSWVLVFKVNDPACPSELSAKYHYVKVGQNAVTAEGSRNMLSIATAAALAGKKVTISYDATESHCYVNRLLMTL